MTRQLCFLLIILIAVITQTAHGNPSGINISGKLSLAADDSAVTSADIDFRIKILSPNGCLLYTERFDDLDLSATGGIFNFTIGSGVGVTNVYDPALNTKAALLKVFSNDSPTLTTLSSYAAGPCTAGTYDPQDGDGRQVVIEFDPSGTSTTYTSLSPFHQIRSVPYAMLADVSALALDSDKLGGVVASNYATTASLATAVPAAETDPTVAALANCNPGDVLTKTAGSLVCTTPSGSSYTLPAATTTVLGGVKTGVAATTGIAVAGDGTISVSSTITSDLSTAKTDITNLQNGKVDKSAMAICLLNEVPVWQSPADNFVCTDIQLANTSQVTGLDAALNGKLSLTGGTMTGDIVMSGAGTDINMGNNIISNIGFLHFENKTADPAFNAANNGQVWYNSSDAKIKFNDGAAIRELGVGGADNLGNHIATQNVRLGANWLSSDGDNEGLLIDSNGQVGIGTATPVSPLHVVATGNGAITLQKSSNDNNSADVYSFKSRGTPGSPTAVQSGDRLMGLYGLGAYSPTQYSANVGAVQILAAENFTATNQGTKVDFGTTPIGSTTRQTRMTVDSTGYVGIGTTAPSGILDVRGGAAAANTAGTHINLEAQDATGPGGAVGGSIYLTPGEGANSWPGGTVVISAFSGQNGAISAGNSTSSNYVTSSSSTSSPSYVMRISNNYNLNNNTALINGTVKNSSVIYQEGYLGFVSVAGAANYSPDFILGMQNGATDYQERLRIQGSTGNVGIGTASPGASSILDISSTTKGVVLPRMTKAQRDAIASPVAGMAIYQTDNTPGLRVYNGTNWMRFTETAD